METIVDGQTVIKLLSRQGEAKILAKSLWKAPRGIEIFLDRDKREWDTFASIIGKPNPRGNSHLDVLNLRTV